MKLRSSRIALLLALAASAAFAHGNKVHVLGTLEKINADSVVVKTKDGKSVEVRLAASTVYLCHTVNQDKNARLSDMPGQDKPAKISDLAVGDMVVIHATPKDNALEADQIKFSVPTTPKVVAPAAPKPKS